MKEKNAIFTTQAAMIAAIYVALCMVFAPISYGEVQIRVAEALTILPFFTPAAVPGLFIGCLIANILGGGIVLDVVLGSIATLIGGVGTYLLRDKSRFLAPLPPILANALIVPFVLRYGYGVPLPIPLMVGTVELGEIIGCGILGMILLTTLSRVPGRIFK